MKELDKLEAYLKENGIEYERIDDAECVRWPIHKILVTKDGRYQWDAICHPGSYGYNQGLLEIMGTIVTAEDGNSVVGWLTAEDVIKRIKKG